jgi:hypothetical protein
MDLIERFKRWKAQGGGMSDSDSETSDSDESKATSDSDSLAWDLTMKAHISPVLLDSDFDPETPQLLSEERITEHETPNDAIPVNNVQTEVNQNKNQRESPSKAVNRRSNDGNSSIPVHLKQATTVLSSADLPTVSSSKKPHQVPTASVKPVPHLPSSSNVSSSNKPQENQSVDADRNRSKSTGVRNDVNVSSKGQVSESVKPVSLSQNFLFPSLEEVSFPDVPNEASALMNRFSPQLSVHYRSATSGQSNARSQAVDGLRDAFEFVDKDCPGVCDFIVKEVIASLCDARHVRQQVHHNNDNGSSGGSVNNHSSSTSSQQPVQSNRSNSNNTSQSTAWRFRNSVME